MCRRGSGDNQRSIRGAPRGREQCCKRAGGVERQVPLQQARLQVRALLPMWRRWQGRAYISGASRDEAACGGRHLGQEPYSAACLLCALQLCGFLPEAAVHTLALMGRTALRAAAAVCLLLASGAWPNTPRSRCSAPLDLWSQGRGAVGTLAHCRRRCRRRPRAARPCMQARQRHASSSRRPCGSASSSAARSQTCPTPASAAAPTERAARSARPTGAWMQRRAPASRCVGGAWACTALPLPFQLEAFIRATLPAHTHPGAAALLAVPRPLPELRRRHRQVHGVRVGCGLWRSLRAGRWQMHALPGPGLHAVPRPAGLHAVPRRPHAGERHVRPGALRWRGSAGVACQCLPGLQLASALAAGALTVAAPPCRTADVLM